MNLILDQAMWRGKDDSRSGDAEEVRMILDQAMLKR